MAKLIGLNAGDKIVEFYGPITGRNYNVVGLVTPVAPRVVVQVFGTGVVQVQQTQTYLFKGNSGLNTFTYDREADQSTWADLGTPIAEADGQTTVNPTVDPEYSAVRVIVETAGTGRVIIQCDWV